MEGVEGVCPRQEIAEAYRSRMLQARRVLDADQIQPSSVDLRLGDKVTCIRSSFLPETASESLEDAIESLRFYADFPLTYNKTSILKRNETYIIPLQESVRLPKGFTGDINPKSTTGRADVMTRVLISGSRKFDTIPDGKHKLYLEVTPLTFNVRVREGSRLSQLRFNYEDSHVDEGRLKMMYARAPLMYDANSRPIREDNITFRHGGIEMHADLSAPIVAYRAKQGVMLDLDLSAGRGALYDRRSEFWDAIEKPKSGQLVLEPGQFYLLATKEKACFPASMCGTLMAYDITSAEGRVHYAGFFDPGFFAPATLEVRVHHAPFRIVDGQPICIMQYEHMRFEPRDEHGKVVVYGAGKYGSNYQNQQRGPNLGKQFLPPLSAVRSRK